jgi:hypothetical protein
MRADVKSILDSLARVERERQKRLSNPQLLLRVKALKGYQQRRFCHTYADLLASERYRPACQFFLKELYGPDDFTQRDVQFSRVVPALTRLFPDDVVKTVIALAELHAISEILDTTMAQNLDSSKITARTYVRAWQVTACAMDRKNQIELTVLLSERLDGFTQSLIFRNSLRLMRRPAQSAGLGQLQRFLESGFDTFKAMNGAEEFMVLISEREQALADSLFSATPAKVGRSAEEVAEFLFLPPD